MTEDENTSKMTEDENTTTESVWTREDVQRVLYHIIRSYEQAQGVSYTETSGLTKTERKTPRRFILFGRRLPFLGGDGKDSELLRDAIRIGVKTLKDNHWWPDVA